MQPNQLLSLEEAKQYIYSIDFSMIVNKMIKHQGWQKNEAETVCALYRNFLFLNKKYQDQHGQLPPSEEVDEFWHNHILDTEKYRRDCQVIFGRYIDHYPYFGIDSKSTLKDLDEAFKSTQQLHKQEFGDYIYMVRTRRIGDKINLFINRIKQLTFGRIFSE